MASTMSALRQVADDIVDIMRTTGGEGGPHMRALMVKHRRRQAEVIERIRARDAEGAEKALRARSGRGRSLLEEMNRAHRQDRGLEVALFGRHDLAGYLHALRSRYGREGPITLEELRETPLDRELLKNALRHEVGQGLDPGQLAEGQLKGFVAEVVTQQVMEMVGVDSAADDAAGGTKAVEEAVTPMVDEIAELIKELRRLRG